MYFNWRRFNYVFIFSLSACFYSCQESESTLKYLSSYAVQSSKGSHAEIVAHDPETQKLFVSSADQGVINIIDISNPRIPQLIDTIDVSKFGVINSVGVASGVVGAAIAHHDAQSDGCVLFYNTDGQFLSKVNTGAMPDMILMTASGWAIVANEGEPNQDYTIDPSGSVAIIDCVSEEPFKMELINMDVFNDHENELKQSGVRLYGPHASAGQDIEPEYIQYDAATQKIFVMCQENNAMAILDRINNENVLVPFGFKDHSLSSNGFDASDKDGQINIQSWPVLGMYQPDAFRVASYAGGTWVFTANEGDSRDYKGFSEEKRVAKIVLDTLAFPDYKELQKDNNLGRLKITTSLGDIDNDGDYDQLYAYGARSFSIWNASTMALVWDSGDDFEQIIAERYPQNFNSNSYENDSFDNRSDDKGPEPEAIELGFIGHKVYAFIGLERQGGVMIYEVTHPSHPQFIDYVNNRNFNADGELEAIGDLGVEDIKFIDTKDSPINKPLLVTANEVSGTVSIYLVNITM